MSLFNRTYHFVDGTVAYGSQVEAEIGNIVTVLNQLDGGTASWTGPLAIAKVSGQLVLGTTNTITVSSTAPSSSHTLTIPDPGADANIMLSAGNTANMSMNSHKITGLTNGSAASDAAAFGQIPTIYNGFQAPVQVVSTTSFATTSTSFALTNLAASITPTSSSHRIRVTISSMITNSAVQTGNVFWSLDRGGTDLGGGSSTGFGRMDVGSGTGTVHAPLSYSYIDSPATTSSTTYTASIRVDAALTGTFGVSGKQVIILEEIA